MFCQMSTGQMLSPLSKLSFYSVCISFAVQMLFSEMEFHLFSFVCVSYIYRFISK